MGSGSPGLKQKLVIVASSIAMKRVATARDICGMNGPTTTTAAASALVRHSALAETAMVCKAVGLAYPASNPGPATSSENCP